MYNYAAGASPSYVIKDLHHVKKEVCPCTEETGLIRIWAAAMVDLVKTVRLKHSLLTLSSRSFHPQENLSEQTSSTLSYHMSTHHTRIPSTNTWLLISTISRILNLWAMSALKHIQCVECHMTVVVPHEEDGDSNPRQPREALHAYWTRSIPAKLGCFY